MSPKGPHNDPEGPTAEAVAVEAVRALLKDREALEALWKKEETLLTMDDVLDRVPSSRPVVKEMIDRRRIPMVKVRGKWVITRKAFREAAERGFPEPKNARFRTKS